MPIYLKQCNKCNKQFEVSCSISEMNSKEHLCECGSNDYKNLINFNGGCVFMGKGFYATEYGNQQGNYGRFNVPWDSEKGEMKK
jgi:putative FmdB family regulatory protein